MFLNREVIMPLIILTIGAIISMLALVGYWIWESYKQERLLKRIIDLLEKIEGGEDND